MVVLGVFFGGDVGYVVCFDDDDFVYVKECNGWGLVWYKYGRENRGMKCVVLLVLLGIVLLGNVFVFMFE